VVVLRIACFLGAAFCGAFCAVAAAVLAGALPWPGPAVAAAAAGVFWAYSALECGLAERFDSGEGWLVRFGVALVAAAQGPFIVAYRSGALCPSVVALLACCVWVLAGYAGLTASVRERGVFPPWAGAAVPFWFGLPAAALSGRPAFAVPAWLALCLGLGRRWFSLAARARALAAVEQVG